MSDKKKFDYGILSSYGTGKFYHRPGWGHYAAKVEAERELALQNAKVVLKEKRIKAGSSLYTFIVRRAANGKLYLVITGNAEKIHYRGSIIVFAPYVPDLLRVIQELSKECFPYQ
jgi:hypothetical protein